MLAKIKYEYLLAAIALAWVPFFCWAIQLAPALSQVGDDPSYLYAAKLLYHNGLPDNNRPLLIAAIQGLPYLFNASDQAVITWGLSLNFLCWFFTAILLFKIISARSNRKKAFVVAVVFFLLIGNLANAFRFVPEPIFILGLTGAIWCMDRYYQSHQIKFAAFAIFILSLETLVKPVALGLALLLFLLFLPKIKQLVLSGYVLLIISGFLLIGMQLHLMKKTYGDYTISYIGATTYYNYLGDKAYSYRIGAEYVPGRDERSKHMATLSEHEFNKLAAADLKDQLKNNTLNLGRAYLFCLWSNSHKSSFVVSDCKNENGTAYFPVFQFLFKAISKLQTIGLTAIGVLLSFFILIRFKKEEPLLVTISVVILYIFFISGMSCMQSDRFHIVFFPAVLLVLARKSSMRIRFCFLYF